MFVFRAPFYLVFVTVSRAFYVFNMINEFFQVKQVSQGHFGPGERKQCKTSQKRQENSDGGFVPSVRRDIPRRRKPPTASASFSPPFWPEGCRRRRSPRVFNQQQRVQTVCQARHNPLNKVAGKDFRDNGEFRHSAQRDRSRRLKSPASSCTSHGGTKAAEQAAKKENCMTASSFSGNKSA